MGLDNNWCDACETPYNFYDKDSHFCVEHQKHYCLRCPCLSHECDGDAKDCLYLIVISPSLLKNLSSPVVCKMVKGFLKATTRKVIAEITNDMIAEAQDESR